MDDSINLIQVNLIFSTQIIGYDHGLVPQDLCRIMHAGKHAAPIWNTPDFHAR